MTTCGDAHGMQARFPARSHTVSLRRSFRRSLCRVRLVALFALATLVLLATTARAHDPGEHAGLALEALTEAAAAVVVDDRARAEDALARAVAEATLAQTEVDSATDTLGRGKAKTRRRAERLVTRTADAERLLADETTPRLALVRACERATRDALRLRSRLAGRMEACPALFLRPKSAAAIRRTGGSFRLKALAVTDGVEAPATVRIGATLPTGADLVPDGLEDQARGRYRLRVTGGVGAVRIDADACGQRASLWVIVRGSNGSLNAPLTQNPDLTGIEYDDAAPSFRVGAVAALAAPDTGEQAPDTIAISPGLPEGLVFDTLTGAITGIPTATLRTTTFVVRATKGTFVHTALLAIDVAPALPAGIIELTDGFEAQSFLTDLAVPVKLAFTPDGRLLFNELTTGNIRIVSAAGTLVTQPFATLTIVTGGERGIAGLAVAPDFATSGFVFAYASAPADGGRPERNRVVRLTATGDVGDDPTVILDDLPIGVLHNGGALKFGPDDQLYVSVGDATVPALSQTDGARGGRVLRIAADGTIPADNPIPNDPEWCRGLRNTFGMAFHPRTGGLFLSENGPTANDELNFAQKGKNFGWGPVPPGLPEFLIGLRIQDWTPVIVPTGITFVAPTTFGVEFQDDLFVCSYDLAEVRRVLLSGSALTDLDEEIPFLRFDDPEAIANKPLDIIEGPGGWLYVSTFTGIWRVRRWSD